jgi:drug/metabolite transporter (DMT)-like permease
MVTAEAVAAPPPPRPRSWAVPAATVVVLLLWASAFVVIREVGDTFSPGPMALLRLTVGSMTLIALALRVRPSLPSGKTLGLVLGYGVSWFAGYTVVINAAERHLDAGTAALLVNVAPIIVAVFAGLFLAEGFPRQLVAGVVVAFGGVALIAAGGPGGHSDRLGITLGLVSAALYGSAVLMQKVVLRSTDALSATWIGCVAGAVVLLPFLPQTVHESAHAAPAAVIGVIYLGIFPTAVAFTLWAYALTRTDAGRMASTTLTVPAIAVLISWVFLSEVPTMLGLLGGAMCLAGVAVSRLRRKPPAQSDGDLVATSPGRQQQE